MVKAPVKSSLLHLSIEEENLSAIPFAVLERRVGKNLGKIEIRGVKLLPDGTELTVSWQVQGNSELGLPTEQDLDIFVALGGPLDELLAALEQPELAAARAHGEAMSTDAVIDFMLTHAAELTAEPARQ